MPIEFQPFEKQLVAGGAEVGLAGSGLFNMLEWRVQSEGDHSGLEAQIVTLHELSHHELNNVTVYGGLLTACAHLAHGARTGRGRYREILTDLVGRSRNAHEAYATWYSSNMYLAQASRAEILAMYSDTYLEHFQRAERLVADIESPFLKQQAAIAAIRICFECSDFTAAGSQLEHLDPSGIDAREFPDARLERLAGLLPAGFFLTECGRFKGRHRAEGELIERACRAGARDDFFPDIDHGVADAATHALLGWLHARLAELFESESSGSNPFEFHLSFFEDLIPRVNALSDDSLVTHPLATNHDPHDNVSNVLLQMESEIVYVREDPLPATAIMLSDIPEKSWPGLVTGDPPHIFLCVRHPSQLLRQHRFPEAQARQLAAASSNVTFLRRRAAVDGAARCELVVFDDPAQIDRFRELAGGVPGFASLSMNALTDAPWADGWIGPIARAATASILFDRSLYHTLKNGWSQFQSVKYAKGILVSDQRKHVFLTFLCLSEDGMYSLFLAPCSELLARSAVAFIREKLPAEKFVEDDAFLSEIGDIVAPVVSHLLAEEHYFSLNELTYRN